MTGSSGGACDGKDRWLWTSRTGLVNSVRASASPKGRKSPGPALGTQAQNKTWSPQHTAAGRATGSLNSPPCPNVSLENGGLGGLDSEPSPPAARLLPEVPRAAVSLLGLCVPFPLAKVKEENEVLNASTSRLKWVTAYREQLRWAPMKPTSRGRHSSEPGAGHRSRPRARPTPGTRPGAGSAAAAAQREEETCTSPSQCPAAWPAPGSERARPGPSAESPRTSPRCSEGPG